MKLKNSYFYTIRENIKDEDSVSGNLLVRAGMIKKISSVIYMYLPLGYKVFMSEPSIDEIGNIGDTVKVHTYYRVMEDDISIFGFNTSEELRLFELLISVSGVGAKTAITMHILLNPSMEFVSVSCLTGRK